MLPLVLLNALPRNPLWQDSEPSFQVELPASSFVAAHLLLPLPLGMVASAIEVGNLLCPFVQCNKFSKFAIQFCTSNRVRTDA